ncbi:MULTISPECIES: cupin domain-containing protein [Caballeronia]|jgi:quercetin dioxygenase-like cupin family protein|uniref:cupin domain-containing protein n=1 Tax=Caballeronia TaxID=1827195 RepID=UPI0015898193|nr:MULTISPECIES: cupin domain-containing protein [Caballeronia]MCG7400078.1 cupin domain-containing protein [Caballeronia zhejiangensis]MCI1043756.1 cupin domain-containing protein [Caballeronia zhejiangensis]
MRKREILVLAAALMIGAASAGAHDAAGAELVTPMIKQAVPEVAGKNVLMATVSYKPGQSSEAHRHPGSIFAYVLEGRVTSQLEGGSAKTYGPGESWYEPPGAHHIVSKNASATKPAKLLVFAIVGDGDPVKQPIPH